MDFPGTWEPLHSTRIQVADGAVAENGARLGRRSSPAESEPRRRGAGAVKQIHKQHRIRCRASYGSDSTDDVGERRSGGPDRRGSGAALLQNRLEKHEGCIETRKRVN